MNDHSLCNPLPCMPVLTPALRLPSHSQVNGQLCIPEVYDKWCRPSGMSIVGKVPAPAVTASEGLPCMRLPTTARHLPSHSQVPSNKVASVTSPIVHVAVHGGGFVSVVATGHACEQGSTFTTKPVVGNGASPCFDQSVDCVVEQVSRDELT